MLSFLKNPRELADFLEVNYKYLIYYLNVKTDDSKYRTFTIKKKNGSDRSIVAPDDQLLSWQRKLATFLIDNFPLKDCVHGFAKDHSIISNATQHVTNRYVFNIDLKDFFPSIHFGRVRGAFFKKPLNAEPGVAHYLSKLCCYNGSLPQGAATSPIISNIICSRLDTQLSRLAKKHHLFYTRYADDITFSKRHTTFPPEIGYLDENKISQVGSEITTIIKDKNDFDINHDKIHLQVNTHRQIVTGLVINKKVNVSRKYVRNIRAMIFDVIKNGIENATKKHIKSRTDRKKPDILTVLRGKVEFVRNVKGENDQVYLNLAARLAKIDNIYLKTLLKRNKEAELRDVFISHASEDKNDIARPLAEELVRIGFKVWYDEYELSLGDSLRTKIEDGLTKSKYGIVILSHSFFSKKWPQDELNGLWSKESNGKKVILPIWFKLSKEELLEYAPMLSDRIALKSDGSNISELADSLKNNLNPKP